MLLAGLVQRRLVWEVPVDGRHAQQMVSSVLRDHEVDPERSGAGVVVFMFRARDALLDGQNLSGPGGLMLRAAVGHAVHFYTWRSLVRDQGLANADAATDVPHHHTCGRGRPFSNVMNAKMQTNVGCAAYSASGSHLGFRHRELGLDPCWRDARP